MTVVTQPTDELLRGRRALEGIAGVAILDDWSWDAPSQKWVLHCRLTIPNGHDIVPSSTDWYVLVDSSYPWGSIKFYPAHDGGLVHTFHHQSHNAVSGCAWRTGDICVDTTAHHLGRQAYDDEPFDASARLRWRFERALGWLRDAANDELVRAGEPFELPHFRTGPMTVAFSENPQSFAIWKQASEQSGTADVMSTTAAACFVTCFYSASGHVLLRPSWGSCLKELGKDVVHAIWIRLSSVPVAPSWGAPTTFDELREAGRQQGIDIDNLVQRAARSIRDGRRNIVLIGFPVPDTEGREPVQMHWQGFLAPILSSGNESRNGYRPYPKGYALRDRAEVFKGDLPIDWIITENWYPDQISTRGRLPEAMIGQSVLLIGAGALGSAVAELLGRGGVRALTIADGEMLNAGNLVRHTLTLQHVKASKASALAGRLNNVSPHVSVTAIEASFPPDSERQQAQCRDCDVVIDCTGSDEAIRRIEQFEWGAEKTFISLSVGFGARRLFCFSTRQARFPLEAFRKAITPWLRRERTETEGQVMPWEGIGCWHPVFPARADDMWLLAAAAVKRIASIVDSSSPETTLVVFEQRYDSGAFAGVGIANDAAAGANEDS